MKRLRFLGRLTVIEALVIAAVILMGTTVFLHMINFSRPARPTPPQSTSTASTTDKPT